MSDLAAELQKALHTEEILFELRELRSCISSKTLPRWVNLKLAAELKGIAYNTLKAKPQLQPTAGKEQAKIGGRRVWRRETILQWLEVTDE